MNTRPGRRLFQGTTLGLPASCGRGRAVVPQPSSRRTRRDRGRHRAALRVSRPIRAVIPKPAAGAASRASPSPLEAIDDVPRAGARGNATPSRVRARRARMSAAGYAPSPALTRVRPLPRRGGYRRTQQSTGLLGFGHMRSEPSQVFHGPSLACREGGRPGWCGAAKRRHRMARSAARRQGAKPYVLWVLPSVCGIAQRGTDKEKMRC